MYVECLQAVEPASALWHRTQVLPRGPVSPHVNEERAAAPIALAADATDANLHLMYRANMLLKVVAQREAAATVGTVALAAG